jgi:hypothetical protein
MPYQPPPPPSAVPALLEPERRPLPCCRRPGEGSSCGRREEREGARYGEGRDRVGKGREPQCDSDPRSQMVEMGGIEPPSIAEEPRLLRAQPAYCVLLGSDLYRRRREVDEPSLGASPAAPRGATPQQAS